MSSLPGEEGRPALYDWAGGREALTRMINAFYDRVEADAELAPLFGGAVTAEHRDHVVAWWSEVLGGPTRYTDELGGYPRMVRMHVGLGITADQVPDLGGLLLGPMVRGATVSIGGETP